MREMECASAVVCRVQVLKSAGTDRTIKILPEKMPQLWKQNCYETIVLTLKFAIAIAIEIAHETRNSCSLIGCGWR